MNLDEIAFLASLPKAPNNYNPEKNYDAAYERRNWVLDRMYSNKFIEEKDLKYKISPIKLFPRNRIILMKLIIFMKKYENVFDKYGEKNFILMD